MIIRCERGLSGSWAAFAPPACCECNGGGNFYLPDVGLRFDTSAGCFGFRNLFLFGFKIKKKRRKKTKQKEKGIVESPFRLCYCYVTTDDHNNTPSLPLPLPANDSINPRLKFVNCDEGHISLFLSLGACACCACACVSWFVRAFCIPLPFFIALQLLVRECGFFALLLLLAVVSFCIRWCEWISHSFSWMCFLKVLFNIWCNYNRH